MKVNASSAFAVGDFEGLSPVANKLVYHGGVACALVGLVVDGADVGGLIGMGVIADVGAIVGANVRTSGPFVALLSKAGDTLSTNWLCRSFVGDSDAG